MSENSTPVAESRLSKPAFLQKYLQLQYKKNSDSSCGLLNLYLKSCILLKLNSADYDQRHIYKTHNKSPWTYSTLQ